MHATIELADSSHPKMLSDLPPLPTVTARLMQMVFDDVSSYREVAELVRADATFSAEVLRLANSSVFAFRHEILDIPHAIAVLGLNRLRGIVMTLALRELLIKGRKSLALTRCWRHNLATALTTEALADAAWMDKGLAYTAGLLHDIGVLAFIANENEAYSQVVEAGPDAELQRQIEVMLFGVDHCEAGRWLLAAWNIPQVFQHVAAGHHAPPEPNDIDIAGLVHVGSLVADMAGFPLGAESPPWDETPIVDVFSERIRQRLADRLDDLPMTIAAKINAFDCEFLT